MALDIVACLTEDGWPVEYDKATNSISYSPPEEQYDAWNAAFTACEAPHLENLREPEDFTPEEWQQLHAAETETAECLRDLGVDVPEVPSLQSYIDRYTGGDPWLSFRFIGDVDEQTFERYSVECPQPTLP